MVCVLCDTLLLCKEYVTWRILAWLHVSHSCEAFACVTWLIHMCHETYSYGSYGSHVCVTRLNHKCHAVPHIRMSCALAWKVFKGWVAHSREKCLSAIIENILNYSECPHVHYLDTKKIDDECSHTSLSWKRATPLTPRDIARFTLNKLPSTHPVPNGAPARFVSALSQLLQSVLTQARSCVPKYTPTAPSTLPWTWKQL